MNKINKIKPSPFDYRSGQAISTTIEKGRKLRLAVFDIDGTIFRSSLVIELSHALVKAGVFPLVAKKEIAKEYLAWKNRKGSYEAYIDKVVKIYVKHITGVKFSVADKIAKEVIAFQKDRVYRFTRDLIKKLKKEKYFLVAISGSPSYIVEKYARAIGFKEFFGTELEVKNGKFTGKVASVESANNKAGILKSLAKKYSTDLLNCTAVGDTEGDIPMLSLVGRPIAFNPNLLLAKQAKKLGWQIVVERKDAVYKVKSFEFINL